jgi:hypothetical protein
MDYPMVIVIMIIEIVIMGIAFFMWYTHKPYTKCEWGREIINQSTMYPDWDTTKLPYWFKYDVMCKDTGEIKIYQDF